MKRGDEVAEEAPPFDDAFRDRLAKPCAWRRDVRRFKPDPVSSPLIEELLGLAASRPRSATASKRFPQAVIANFNACNARPRSHPTKANAPRSMPVIGAMRVGISPSSPIVENTYVTIGAVRVEDIEANPVSGLTRRL